MEVGRGMLWVCIDIGVYCGGFDVYVGGGLVDMNSNFVVVGD